MADDVVLRFNAEGADKVLAAIKSLQQAAESLNKTLQQSKGPTGPTAPGGPASPEAVKGLGEMVNQFKTLIDTYKGAAAASTSLEGVVNTVTRAFTALTSPLGLAVTGLGATAGAFGAVTHHAAATAQAVYGSANSIARVSGMTVESADTLSNTFKLAGSNADILSLAMFRMGNEIDEGGKHLRRWGIEIRNSDGSLKTAGQTFVEFRDRMSIATPMERNAAALDLFGRQARSVLPLLALNREKYAELSQQAELNSRWTEDLTEKTKAYRTATESLSQKWEGFWLGIASRSLTILTTWAERAGKLVDVMKAAANIVGLGQGPPTQEGRDEEEVQLLARRYRLGLTKEGARPESDIKLDEYQKNLNAYMKEAEEIEKRGFPKFTPRGTLTTLEEDDEFTRRARSEIAMRRQREGERGQPGPSANEESRRLLELQIRGKYDVLEKAIQADMQYYQQRARLAGESEGDISRIEESGLKTRLENENKRYADLRKRRDELPSRDRAQDERDDLEHQEKVTAIQSALRSTRLKTLQGDVAAQKKALDEQLADQKAASDQILTFIEAQKQARLSLLDIRGETGMGAVRERQGIEEEAARQTGLLQRMQVDAQIEAKDAQLKAAQATGGQMLEMERQLIGEINALQGQRYSIETQTNEKILASRKQLFEATKRLRMEEAEAGSSARAAARAYLAEQEGEEPPDQLAQLKQQAAQMVREQGRGGGGRGRGRRGGRQMTEDEALDALIMQMPETLRPSRQQQQPRSKGPLSDQDVENILGQMQRDAERGFATGAPTESEERHGQTLLGIMEGFIKRGGGTFAGISGKALERMRAALAGDRSFLLGGPGEAPEVEEPGRPPGITARGARAPGTMLGEFNAQLDAFAKVAAGATDALKGLTPFLGDFAQKIRGVMGSGEQQGPPSPAGTIDFGQGPVPVPSYQHGGQVKKTGPALLHAGEWVLPMPIGSKERAEAEGQELPRPSLGRHLLNRLSSEIEEEPITAFQLAAGAFTSVMPLIEKLTGASMLASRIANPLGALSSILMMQGSERPGAMEGVRGRSPALDKAQRGTDLPSYQEGGVVQETGPALLHAGERVVPLDQGLRFPVGGYWGGNQPSPSFGGGLVSGFFPEGASRSEELRNRAAQLDITGPMGPRNMWPTEQIQDMWDRFYASGGSAGQRGTGQEGGILGEMPSRVSMSAAGPPTMGKAVFSERTGRMMSMSGAGPPTLPKEMQGITDSTMDAVMRTGRVMSMSGAGPPTQRGVGGGAEAVFESASPQLRAAFQRMLAAMRGSGDREAGARALHAETRIDPSSQLARSIVSMFMDILNRERIAAVGIGR